MSSKVIDLPAATPERFVSRQELAQIMGIGLTTLDDFVKAGMPSETWGLRTRRFLPSQAIAWARARAAESDTDQESHAA